MEAEKTVESPAIPATTRPLDLQKEENGKFDVNEDIVLEETALAIDEHPEHQAEATETDLEPEEDAADVESEHTFQSELGHCTGAYCFSHCRQ